MKIKVEHEGQVYYVKKPGYKEISEAKMHSAKVFNQARLGGAMLKSQLWDHMRQTGLWTEEKQKELETLDNLIDSTLLDLKKGKNGKLKTLSDARKGALMVRVARMQKRMLMAEYSNLEGMTIDGLSDQAYFDSLVTSCVLNEEGTKVFSNIDDYFERSNEPWVSLCTEELGYLIYSGIDRNWEQHLPENQFLSKYGFVNSKLELINKEGQLVDFDMKPITKEPEPDFSEFDNDLWLNTQNPS